MKGLTENTERLFHRIANLSCLKRFTMVGGTALSLQIGHRLSEDLDFMQWSIRRDESTDIGWASIGDELSTVGIVEHTNVLGFDHVEFVVDGVKLSFYHPDRTAPQMSRVLAEGNIQLADIEAIGMMKMEVLLRRAKFRDYYDIYAILQEGGDLDRMVDGALAHSRHQLKRKNLLAMLSNGSLFQADSCFPQLQPRYAVTAADIEAFIRQAIATM